MNSSHSPIVLGFVIAVALLAYAGCADKGGSSDGLTGARELSQEAVPDFAIADVNPNSATYDQEVSPRDYLGGLSAWYFGLAT
jgi:hypothetical protein